MYTIKSIISKSLGLNLLEQQRITWTRRQLSKVPPNSTIIDIGAGEQYFKQYCSHLQYTSQDQGEYTGTGQEGLHTGSWDVSDTQIICDAASLPIASESYDAVLCTEVLEHATKPIDIMHEISRILKPGGTLILTVPVTSLTHFAPHYYHTGFSKYFFQYYSSKFGLKIAEQEYVGGLADRTISQNISGKDRKYHQSKYNRLIWLLLSAIIILCASIQKKYETRPMQELGPCGIMLKMTKCKH
jgi:SAM-dependent methyltransferase